MSVVNQMLRELEQRRDVNHQLPLQATHNQTSYLKIIIWSIFCILFIAVFYYFFNLAQTYESQLDFKPDAVEHTSNPVKNQIDYSTNNQVALSTEPAKPELTIASTQKSIPTIQPKVAAKPLPLVSLPDRPVTIKVSQPKILTSTGTINKTIIKKTNRPVKRQSIETRLNIALDKIKSDYFLNGFDNTKQSLLALLKQKSSFHSARLYLLKLQKQNNDPDTLANLKTAVALYPNQVAFRLAAANHYLELGQYQQSEKFLINIDPSIKLHANLLQMRALVRQKQNKHQLAINDYISFLRLNPGRGEIYLAMGLSFEALDKLQRAKLSYQQAALDKKLSQRQLQFVNSKIQKYQQLRQG